MNRRRSAVVWGLVGALTFLVLHQAYLLVGGSFIGVVPVVAIALVVWVVTAILTYVLEPRIARTPGRE